MHPFVRPTVLVAALAAALAAPLPVLAHPHSWIDLESPADLR